MGNKNLFVKDTQRLNKFSVLCISLAVLWNELRVKRLHTFEKA